MKFILLNLTTLICCLSLYGQVTFERTYPLTSLNAIEELGDGNFIGTGDSLQNGLIYQIDRYGNLMSTFFPRLRDSRVSVQDITTDDLNGGFAICGYSDDTSGNNYTGYYLLVDSNFQSIDSIYYGGGVNGPNVDIVLRDSNNDFVIAVGTFLGGGGYSTGGQKINYPSTNSWLATGGGNHATNGMALDQSNRLFLASFNWVAAASASLLLFDTAGVLSNTFSITDTAYGGSLVFQSVTSTSHDGNYMFGVELSPNSGTYSVAYLSKLDSTLNIIWDKYLDWGYTVNIVAMTPTEDSCLVLLLSTSNGLALHKVTSSGDSLWTQFHNRPTTGAATRFEECADRGFVIVGQFNGTVSYGYILKTDSLGRLLPDATVDISGQMEFCFGDTTILTATIGYDYLWSTGDTTQSILVTTGGNYFVTVTDSIGLQAISDSISILVHTPVQPTISHISDTLYSSIASNYQWYLNDTLISGATNQSYTALANGLYTVETTDSNGCHSFSAVYDLTTVGLQNISLKSIDASFIPNPTSNQGSLVLHGIHSDKLEVSLFNQMGQKIETLFKGNFLANETNILLDFSMYNSGVYVIRVNSGELSTNLRVLVLK